MADRVNRPSRASLSLLFVVLVTPSFAAPPADMETVIEEYQADQRSASSFYDLPWSIARFDRMERLQHNCRPRLRVTGQVLHILQLHALGRPRGTL